MSTRAQVVGVVSFYMVAALVMVVVNKLVLDDAPDLPLLLIFFQSVMSVVLLEIIALRVDMVKIPLPRFRPPNALAPLLIVDALGLVFNTLCLRDVDTSFFQVARGLVLPMTIAASSLHTRRNPSKYDLLSTFIVTLGFFIGIYHPSHFTSPTSSSPTPAPSLSGIIFGILSALAIAIHAVLVKISLNLQVIQGSTTHLAYYSNLGRAAFLAIGIILNGELSVFVGKIGGGVWDWRVFAGGNLVTGFFGFLISIAGILSIKVTSPVTHMFSSAARSVLQTLLGVKLFGDKLTMGRVVSIATISAGTILYTWAKSQDKPPERKEVSTEELNKDIEALLADERKSDEASEHELSTRDTDSRSSPAIAQGRRGSQGRNSLHGRASQQSERAT